MQIITQTALALIGLPLLIFTAGTQDAEPFKGPDDALPTVPSLVRDALLEGRTEDALDTLDQLAELHPESQDFWTLLRISALTEGKDLAQAVKVAEAFEQDHAQSPWLAKVRFRRAENLRQLRRFEEAEQIYEASAQALRSPERQGRLAQVYLVHAVRMAADRKPNEPDQGEQDLRGARELFGRVLDLDAPISAVEHALFERAVCSEKLGAHEQAVQDWQIYLARNGTNRHQEARLRKGLAQLAHNRAGDALRTLEDLVQDALKESGNSQGPEEDAALRILSRARFAIAQAWAKRGMRDLARAAYGRFLEAHAEDEQAAQARQRAYEFVKMKNEILTGRPGSVQHRHPAPRAKTGGRRSRCLRGLPQTPTPSSRPRRQRSPSRGKPAPGSAFLRSRHARSPR